MKAYDVLFLTKLLNKIKSAESLDVVRAYADLGLDLITDSNKRTLIFKAVGDRKIDAIKTLRNAIPGLELIKAKETIESPSPTLFEGLTPELAEKTARELVFLGCIVDVV